ncbi:MAG: hypothetical protein HOP17_07660 [Acidobacteria bacterium]|nr:hypothetical protein [Acidobacteriota bacterium]
MKRFIVKTGLLAAAAIFFSFTANAQIARQYTAEIPFDFVVKDKTMAAGNYSVGPISGNSALGTITLLDKKNGGKFVIGQATLGSEEMKVGKLTFVKNGSTYVLSRIATPSFRMNFKPRTDSLAGNRQAVPEVVAINLK